MHDEKLFWERYWQSRIDYFLKSGNLFEDNFVWGYYSNKNIYQNYKDILGDIDGLKILEWGAGSGYVSCLAARDNADMTIMDYSKNAIKYANIVSKKLKVEGCVKIIQGDLSDLVSSKKFDVIWGCGVMEHYSDKEIVLKLKEMINLTKGGGIIISTMPNLNSPEGRYRCFLDLFKNESRSERILSFKHWISLFEEAGLKNVKIVPIDYYVPSFVSGRLANFISRHIPLTKKHINLAWLFSVVGKVDI